jgi:prepilin-type N-terminal cleavage/methylation domain-containing protein
VKSGATSRGIWPQEIRFFPKDLSPLSPIVAKRLEFPAGQVPSWSSSYPGCGIYVCTGPGSILGRVGGKVYVLKPRDLVLIPPGAPVCWFAEKTDSGLLAVHFLPSLMMVDMNTRELAAFLSSFRFGRDEEVKVRSLPREAFQAITARLQTMLAEQGDAPGERGLKWKVLLGDILLQTLPGGSNGRVPGESFWTDPAWQRLPKVLDYLHKNCHEDLYAEKISKDLGLPDDFLATEFPGIMGQRWNRYLLDYRIRLAAGLLRQKNARISFVAQECGFPTLSHFNASFRKVIGMAPRDFYKSCESRFVSGDGVGKPRRMKAKAFTLVELLVTISIIGLLAALSIPAIQTARETAEVGGCMSNIRQLTTAMLAVAADNNGRIFAGDGSSGWATSAGAGTTVTNGFLWSNGYVKNTKVFLCPHGRKSGPPWFGSPACHYSLNVALQTNNPVNTTEILANRIQNPSKVIMLFEEAIVTQAQDTDCRALLDANLPADQGDARLFTQQSGMVNHRKKGCVSFYDGSALSLTATEWQTMLNTQTKRKLYYGVP